MSSTRRSAPALAIAALLVASAFTDESAAQSGSKAACASAFEQAQQQRRNGSLMRARKHLTFCSQRACGAVAQRECTALLDQVEREMPSAVLSLEDESGQELEHVSVQVDGQTVTRRLDGRAISLDPGTHTFAFTTKDGRKQQRRATILVGAANQRVVARLEPEESAVGSERVSRAKRESSREGRAKAKADRTRSVPEERSARERDEEEDQVRDSSDPVDDTETRASAAKSNADKKRVAASPVRPSVLPYVFAGIGAAGVGGFLALGAMRNSAERSLPECYPNCSEDRVQRVRRLAIAANVSLAVGGAAIVTSAVLLFTQKPSREQTANRARPPRYALSVLGSSHGAYAEVKGSF